MHVRLLIFINMDIIGLIWIPSQIRTRINFNESGQPESKESEWIRITAGKYNPSHPRRKWGYQPMPFEKKVW
jgi:hypothetical protein